MKRSSLVYPGLLLVLIAGLWAVLHAGPILGHAPAPIGGRYDAVQNGPTVVIEQSGLHVQVAVGDGPAQDLLMDPDGGPTAPKRLTGAGTVLEIAPITNGTAPDQYRLTLTRTGQPAEQWTAVRHTVAGGEAGMATVVVAAGAAARHPLLLLLTQLCVILAVSRLLGYLASLVGQPQVVGEMIAGIALGPSLLGLLWPAGQAALFPADSTASLNLLAQLGVLLFLFLIGLELEPRLLKNRGHTALVISHASIVVPLLLGAGLAIYLYPRVFNDTPAMRFSAVALFMGAAMSITAFPVLARILTERNLHKTPVGAVSITCAAVDDVTAWCMLAFVVAFASASGLWSAVATAGWSLVYVAAMFVIVRPFLRRLAIVHDRRGRLTPGVLAVVLLLALLSALATEAIGIHALFGAFLMGAIMPRSSGGSAGTPLVREVTDKLEDFVTIFLLPVFFAYTGLRTRIGLLNTPDLWLLTALVIGVACLGKFGGSTVAARACGLGWRESFAIGVLMNTRGLMELIILNVGRSLGVITDAVFAMMVLMALATTFMTTPILNLVYPARLFRRAASLSPAGKAGFNVLIPVALPRSGVPLLVLADLLTRSEDERLITAVHFKRPADRDAYRAAAEGPAADAATVATAAGRSGTADETLAPLLEEARRRAVAVEPLAQTTTDVAADLGHLALDRRASLVLMGFHKPVIGATILGGTVHRVLTTCPVDVAIFVDRGLREVRTVLVPWVAGPHDRLALSLADRIARASGAKVTLLHIVAPGEGEQPAAAGMPSSVDPGPSSTSSQYNPTVRIVPSHNPVEAVIEAAGKFDLMLLGIDEQWGLESQLFGFRPERIARDCPTSLVIVRKASPSAT